MKSKILLIAAFLLTGWNGLKAQAPQAVNYQAVVRDNTGAEIVSHAVGVEFKIHTGSQTGAVVYDETQALSTNALGIVTAAIGQGTVVSGTFNTIAWSGGQIWLECI